MGEALDVAETASLPVPTPGNSSASAAPDLGKGAVVSAALRQRETMAPPVVEPKQSEGAEKSHTSALAPPDHSLSSGTVVLDVEQGGIVVPSFAGRTVRGAIELAEDSGLDLDAVGSGLGRDQSPQAGSHVATGSRVTVKFGR